MVVRNGSFDPNIPEMCQTSESPLSTSNLMGSLIKTFKAPSLTASAKKSSHNRSNSLDNMNYGIITKSNVPHESYVTLDRHSHISPIRPSSSGALQCSTPSSSIYNHHFKKKDKYFTDLDEDWSAVIDDHNTPIPMINNGGIERVSHSPYKNISKSFKSATLESPKSVTKSFSNNTQNNYPKLPFLNHCLSHDLKSQLEHENEKYLQELNSVMKRISKFDSILHPINSFDSLLVQQQQQINLTELRKISWNGIPIIHRPIVWKLLIGYMPTNIKRQSKLLERKRKEYCDGIDHVFSDNHSRDMSTWHQIEIDIPRTNPQIPLYQFSTVQKSLQNILYLWAIRHPASGYVQGINDLVTPFYQVFLSQYLPSSQKDDVEILDPSTYLVDSQMKEVEADSFWCLTKLVEQITDNYIHGQPGILKQMKNLSQLVKRIDLDLFNHFEKENVEFIQFSVRWMNCLLMREFKMDMVIRMWDTYLSETCLESTSDSFMNTTSLNSKLLSTPSIPLQTSNIPSSSTNGDRLRQTSLSEFHVFVCAAFLVKWSDRLMRMDFQEIITFLQNPPTKNWKESDMEMLLSEAYIWQSLYKDASSHWR